MSNLGKWTTMNANPVPGAYGSPVTYHMGVDYLDGLTSIEDWGSGRGYFRSLLRRSSCVNVDGSPSPHADRVVDLVEYRSRTDGLYMRHILEHNWEWKKVLANAVASFEKRMMLVLFTPWSPEETRNIELDPVAEHGIDCPDLSFNRNELLNQLAGCHVHLVENIPTRTQYRVEHVIYLSK